MYFIATSAFSNGCIRIQYYFTMINITSMITIQHEISLHGNKYYRVVYCVFTLLYCLLEITCMYYFAIQCCLAFLSTKYTFLASHKILTLNFIFLRHTCPIMLKSLSFLPLATLKTATLFSQ